jgi:hypothetical protein
MTLIKETNEQYYAGQQAVHVVTSVSQFISTFDTVLKLYSADSWVPSNEDYNKNNFTLEFSVNNTTFTDVNIEYSVEGGKNSNIFVKTVGNWDIGYYRVTLKEKQYGNYRYTSITDVINNFYFSYVGFDRLLPSAKKNEIAFHAKRALQEFSYDVLKSIKKQELAIPNNLTVPIPQDYVNHVKASWIDDLGVAHIIYPTRLTSNPTEVPVQDGGGVPVQDSYGENITATSITEENWSGANMKKITGGYDEQFTDASIDNFTFNRVGVGQRYGANPETTQLNGFFTINEREGKLSFSSDLVDKVIILEYISDGLAYDADMQIPKLAEDAVYSYILYAIASSKNNLPEYIINRLRKEKRAKIRNAKIRLSNIKLEEITQVFRNKSKIIKH